MPKSRIKKKDKLPSRMMKVVAIRTDVECCVLGGGGERKRERRELTSESRILETTLQSTSKPGSVFFSYLFYFLLSLSVCINKWK